MQRTIEDVLPAKVTKEDGTVLYGDSRTVISREPDIVLVYVHVGNYDLELAERRPYEKFQRSTARGGAHTVTVTTEEGTEDWQVQKLPMKGCKCRSPYLGATIARDVNAYARENG